MGWAKFDDQTHRRRKIRGLSDAAWRLWASAVIDCCAEGSDGVIEGVYLRELLPRHHEDHVRELLARGLLHDQPGCDSDTCLSSHGLPVADSDLYVVHDFAEWQITTEEWEARKQASEKANHVRHHVNKKIRKEGCRLCYPPRSDSESGSEAKRSTVRSPDLTRPDQTRPDPFSPSLMTRGSGSSPAQLQTARETTEESADDMDTTPAELTTTIPEETP